MSHRVLVTRAAAQGEGTAARLRARGHTAVLAPLVRIERMAARLPPALQAILATSRNGAEALAEATGRRDVPVLAVGEATARTLREAGFADVRSANGDADALAALALAALAPDRGPVLHARGAEIRRSPLDPLRAAGFETAEAVLYRTAALDTLPPEALACTAALVHSPGSARRLHDAMPPGAPRLAVVAISEAALLPLRDAPFAASLHAAAHPSEEAMLDLLDDVPKNPVAPDVPLG